jgi:hypothetical protein
MTEWQPFREPLRRTLTRTVGIALLAGGVFACWRGGLARWPAASAVLLWPSLGGHWVELWFLNWLRPRLADRPVVRIAARIAVWFVGGVALAAGMWLTTAALPGLRAPRAAWWWLAGLAFVGVELAAHLAFQFRGRPSVFNGRG